MDNEANFYYSRTVQSVAFLDHLNTRENIPGPFLVVAPLSTVPHWERTVRNWTNMNSIVYHGNVASRGVITAYELFQVICPHRS